MEELWNLVVNNKDYIFKLFVTILAALLGLIPVISKIKANRTNKVFEEIIQERKQSHDDIYKFLFTLPRKSIAMKDYKECELLWKDKVISGYFELFDNIENIEKFKRDLEEKRLYNKILNYKVDKYLFFMQSYVQTCIIWLYKNDSKLTDDPQIKIFLSDDLMVFIRKISDNLNKFYDNKEFQRFRKNPKIRWLSWLIARLEYKIWSKNTNLEMCRYVRLTEDKLKTADKKLLYRLSKKKYLLFKEKYFFCSECSQKCSVKNSFNKN